MELPDGCKAYLLLHAANLTEELEKLARTTSDMTFTSMKEKIMRIFEDGKADYGGDAPSIKQEAFTCQHCQQQEGFIAFTGRGGRAGRGRGNRGRGGYRCANLTRGRQNQNQNPTDQWGNVRWCHECDSRHFVSECPERLGNAQDAHFTSQNDIQDRSLDDCSFDTFKWTG